MQTLSEPDIRRIVREELVAILGVGIRRKPPAPPPPWFDPLPDMRRFIATLGDGERVGASALYGRWKGWAATEAPAAAGMTMTAFGRAAVRVGGLVRGSAMGRRFYARSAAAGPEAGAGGVG